MPRTALGNHENRRNVADAAVVVVVRIYHRPVNKEKEKRTLCVWAHRRGEQILSTVMPPNECV